LLNIVLINVIIKGDVSTINVYVLTLFLEMIVRKRYFAEITVLLEVNVYHPGYVNAILAIWEISVNIMYLVPKIVHPFSTEFAKRMESVSV